MLFQISSLTKWFQALGTDVFLFVAVSYHVHIQISVRVDQDKSTLSIKLYDELDRVDFIEIVRNSIKDQTTKSDDDDGGGDEENNERIEILSDSLTYFGGIHKIMKKGRNRLSSKW